MPNQFVGKILWINRYLFSAFKGTLNPSNNTEKVKVISTK